MDTKTVIIFIFYINIGSVISKKMVTELSIENNYKDFK